MRHLEDNLQITCVSWFDLQYPHYQELLFHPPNGGKRNAREAARFKRMGVRRGASDLILMMPRKGYHGLCIEMKAGKGTQTENQKLWQNKVEAQGYKYEVCRDFDEFQDLINEYLKI